MTASISVVLRTKNGITTTRQTLAALAAQSIQPLEWIVMDCRSTDGVRELATSYGARIIDVDPDTYFPGKVLNRAAEAASGDLVVFVNSDTTPLLETSLEALVRPLDDPEVAATFGRQVVRPEALGWVRGDYDAAFPAEGPAPDWLPMSLPFSAIRRELLDAHPFYTDAWASEDTEWGVRARRAGLRIEYVPRAIAMHSHDYTLPEIRGRRYVEGEADAFIHPERRLGAARLARRWASTVARDLRIQWARSEWLEMLRTPLRRAVFWGAWARGNRWGRTRRTRALADTGRGQRTILSLRRDA